MSLLTLLPTPEEVNRCIKPEAEGAHEAIVLAVHQPAPLSFRRFNSSDRTPTTEAALIEHLLTPDVPTGALVVPVTGKSGVGKSHLVRIIDAYLRRSAGASRYVIVRIPKSASLRRVVELILELLPEARYEGVKSAFRNAVSEVDFESASIRFHGELEIALRDKAKQLLEVASQAPTDTVKEQLDHAKRLPLLLSDPITAPHFREHVFPRIVRRAVAGSEGVGIDSNEGQFLAADFELPENIDLGQAALPASRYYLTAIQARDGHGRVVAANLLNTVVDQATRQLFNLQDALGGMTLQDVILEVRKLLLRDRKELVLLVEDFAALTGIQETLAKVLIQEGVRDGKTQLATLRSVIAVTDGYLLSRDTLATRAMYEWVVESSINSEEEVFRLARKLVASYLNAARWGEAQLIERYGRHQGKDEGAREWLPPFEGDGSPESSRILDGFGYEDGIPLFPYTQAAIDYLTRRALTQGDAMLFNPRFIINEVLRKLLLPARSAFEAKRFPPPIIETNPSADVAQWLATLHVANETKERMQRVAVIWGNAPQLRGDIAHIPSEVFQSFDLRPPDLQPTPPTTKLTAKEPPPQTSQTVAPALSAEIEEIRGALERWAQGTLLPQQIALKIRKALSSAINEQVDWNAERMLRVPIEPRQISIPNAGGQGGVSEKSISIAREAIDPDGRIRSDLLSLTRSRAVYENRTDYAEFEDDLARVANLVSRLLPETRALIRQENERQCQFAIIALRTNTLGLGIGIRGKTTRSIKLSLLSDAPVLEELPPESPNAFKEWRAVQSEMLQIRPRLKGLVIATCGCYQGIGDKPNGVDIVRLVEKYPPAEVPLEIASLERLSQADRQLLVNMAENRLAPRVRALATEWERLRKSITDAFGTDFDKNELTSTVRDLADNLKNLGAWSIEEIGCNHAEVTRAIEDFRTAPVKECLDQPPPRFGADIEEEATESGVTGRADVRVSPALTASKFARLCAALVTASTRHAEFIAQQSGGIRLEDEQKKIDHLLSALAADLDCLPSGGVLVPTR